MKIVLMGLLVACYMVSTAQSGRSHVQDSVFIFNNTSFKTALQLVCEYNHIKICNPRSVKGMSITGNFLCKCPVTEVCHIITVIEGGVVFLNYQNGVIYVSKRAFPKKFKPIPSEWPCN